MILVIILKAEGHLTEIGDDYQQKQGQIQLLQFKYAHSVPYLGASEIRCHQEAQCVL